MRSEPAIPDIGIVKLENQPTNRQQIIYAMHASNGNPFFFDTKERLSNELCLEIKAKGWKIAYEGVVQKQDPSPITESGFVLDSYIQSNYYRYNIQG